MATIRFFKNLFSSRYVAKTEIVMGNTIPR